MRCNHIAKYFIMTRKLFFIPFIFFIVISCKGAEKDSITVDFTEIIEKFRQHEPYFYTFNGLKVNTVSKDSLFISKDFSVSVSNDPVYLEIQELTSDIEVNKSNQLSFTAIYGDYLVSLVDTGKFICQNKDSFVRDKVFEDRLNSKQFIYHFVIDDKLVAKTQDSIYYWSNNEWKPYSGIYPLSDTPVLFDDDDFLVFEQCAGEWGGIAFFIDKKSSNIYPFEATCANTVFKDSLGYHIISALNHLSALSYERIIENPRKQKPMTREQYTKLGMTIPYNIDANSKITKQVFDFYSIMVYSMFRIDNRQLYLCNVEDISFLAEIKDRKVEVVNPLFNKTLEFGSYVTRVYGDYTLFCYTSYSNYSGHEGGFFVVHNNKLTSLCWN